MIFQLLVVIEFGDLGLLQVRAAIASQFQDVAHSVSPADAAHLLRRPLVTLLKDNTPEVRTALMPQLAGTLQVRPTMLGA